MKLAFFWRVFPAIKRLGQPARTHTGVRGVRMRTVNLVLLGLSLLLFCLVLYSSVQISRDYARTVATTEKYISLQQAGHLLHAGSEYLREQAWLYAASGKAQYARRYFDARKTDHGRLKALEQLRSGHFRDAPASWLARAPGLARGLDARELYSIRLTAQATGQNPDTFFPQELKDIELQDEDRHLDARSMQARALSLLESADYGSEQAELLDPLHEFLDQTVARTQEDIYDQSATLGRMLAWQRILLLALFLLNIFTFILILALFIRPLAIYRKSIRKNRMLEPVGSYECQYLARIYNDVFLIKERHDQALRHKAEHDELTGLLNRASFEKFRQILAAEGRPLALALIDVDHFKEVNDTFGHSVGDSTLRRVASLLQRHFRSYDLCLRLGGDEFAVIVKGDATTLRPIIADKIEHINQELEKPQRGVPATSLSVGIAFCASGFSESLFEEADQALYAVKERGRRGYAFYDGHADRQQS